MINASYICGHDAIVRRRDTAARIAKEPCAKCRGAWKRTRKNGWQLRSIADCRRAEAIAIEWTRIREEEQAIQMAMKQDYPSVLRYLAPLPLRQRTLRRLRAWPDHAWTIAASRISESMGLGSGSEWLRRHRPSAATGGVEARAASQVLASLSSIAKAR